MHRLRRRLLSVPALGVSWLVVTAAFPLLLGLALLVDLARWAVTRRPWMASRLTAFLWCYLSAEAVGVALLTGAWLIAGFGASRAGRLVDSAYAIQRMWAGAVFVSVRAIFSLRFEVEGAERAAPGPVLVLIRHTSIIDTLLPTVFITARYGLRLRFVLKRELLIDPCLDIAGLRLPNHFVSRATGDRAADLEGLRALATGLTAREAVLIYPEGTRFTEAKRTRALEDIRANAPELYEVAEGLARVLPPKVGGVLALLDASPECDVLVVAHTGLEGFARVVDIWRGAMVNRVVRVKCWRVARGDVPTERAQRVMWLMRAWAELDRWVAETATTVITM